MTDYLIIPFFLTVFTLPIFLYFEICLFFSQEPLKRPIIHGIFFNAFVWLVLLIILIAFDFIYGFIISIVGGGTFLLSNLSGVIVSFFYDGRETGLILRKKARSKLFIAEYIQNQKRSEDRSPTYFTIAISLLLINLAVWIVAVFTLLIFREDVLLICSLLLHFSIILSVILFIISFIRGEKYKEVSVSLIVFSVLLFLVFSSLLDVRVLIEHLF